MRTVSRISLALAAITMLAIGFADTASAQRRRPAPAGDFQPSFELSATYGSMWGGNISFSGGEFRTATGASMGFNLGYSAHPFGTVELGYTRQDGGLDLDRRGGKERLTDMSVNYWHLGGTKNLMPGPMTPFVLTSLGLTYYSPKAETFTIDDETYRSQSATKFSMALGLGLKAYFGEAEKIGLRATFKVLPTLYNSGAGLWFGSGGGGISVSGNAIWQWEAAAGLTVKFGG